MSYQSDRVTDGPPEDGDCSYLKYIYNRLLTDVRDMSGVPFGIPDDVSSEWLLIKGPLLDKNVLYCLELNQDCSPIGIPLWLLPLWDKFLESKDSKILRLFRMCLVFCYKVEFEPTHDQIQEAQASFIETDSNLEAWEQSVNSDASDLLLRSARSLIGRVVYRCDWFKITPSHGPGAVFPPCKQSERSNFDKIYESIQEYYPYDRYFNSLPENWISGIDNVREVVPKDAPRVAKLVSVPKDSRGPRLICVHPRELIWIQQGQRRVLERAIETCPLTKGKINFTDQTVNSSLALSSSSSRDFVTLDLKEASDRISCLLVKRLLGDWLYGILSCGRATHVKLLDNRVMELRKWCPMGNALCFPIESLIFWAVVRAGIALRYGINCNDIYVFGDDILYPSQYHEGALNALVRCGLVPNPNKTFVRGFFRESCGVDAYNGKDVTPLRLRTTDNITAQGCVSLCDLAKRLVVEGFTTCAASIYSSIRSNRYLPLCGNFDESGIYEYVPDMRTVWMYEPTLRWRASTQHWSVRILRMRGTLDVPLRDGWYHLSDSLRRLDNLEGWFSDRGTEYTVPYQSRPSYGWADCQ